MNTAHFSYGKISRAAALAGTCIFHVCGMMQKLPQIFFIMLYVMIDFASSGHVLRQHVAVDSEVSDSTIAARRWMGMGWIFRSSRRAG